MKEFPSKKDGFVLLMALFVVALGSILVAALLQRAVTYDRLHKALLRQQYARMLALNGIEIARAQLSNTFTIESEKKPLDQDLVPFLYTNYLQTFNLNDEQKNLTGEIHLYISCEDGKINPQLMYDFDEKKYKLTTTLDGRSTMKLCSDFVQKKCEFPAIEKAFEKRFKQGPLEDITDIFSDYNNNVRLYKEIVPLSYDKGYVTDLFTLATSVPEWQPLYISASLALLLNIERNDISAEKQKGMRLDIVKKLQASDKKSRSPEQWDELLAPLYKKGYTEIPDAIKKIMASKIETTSFLVISYGKVENGDSMQMIQKVCAYLEKITLPETKKSVYIVKRLCWL